MELKPGDKLREARYIPANWDAAELGALVSYVGSGKSRTWSIRGTYPVYGSTGAIGYTDTSDYSGDAILVARVGANAGKLNVVSGSYGVTDNTIIIKFDGDSSLVFFSYQLESKRLNTLVFGSGQPLITGTQLKHLIVCVPPKPEQDAIAEALNDVDELIGALERLIAKKRDLKQATMQQLLTGKRRLLGFSGNWETKRLGDESELITKGTTPTSLGRSFVEQGIAFVKVESLSEDGTIIPEMLASIDEETHHLLKRSQLRENDILFSIAGALGRTAIVRSGLLPANTNQALGARPSKGRNAALVGF